MPATSPSCPTLSITTGGKPNTATNGVNMLFKLDLPSALSIRTFIAKRLS